MVNTRITSLDREAARFATQRAEEDRMIDAACRKYGFDRKQFMSARQDKATGYFSIAFKPARSPFAAVEPAQALHGMLSDEFRGALIRAAVPEFAELVAKLTDAILNPQPQIVTVDPDAYTMKP